MQVQQQSQTLDTVLYKVNKWQEIATDDFLAVEFMDLI